MVRVLAYMQEVPGSNWASHHLPENCYLHRVAVFLCLLGQIRIRYSSVKTGLSGDGKYQGCLCHPNQKAKGSSEKLQVAKLSMGDPDDELL